ncbi:hypothetical protein F5Y04DRAFT_29247 [Hypomontagnella monticulosa]|nr:hypothetical protein F5Y04DRAFT_29247 [Hypomontagnella monticulosa]
MEVLGGISSFIAIGQGVAAIPKIIKAVRIVAQSRKELQDLIFELEILVARYDHTKESLSLFAPIAGGAQLIVTQEEPYYMKILRTKLDMLLEELQELAKDCQALSEESSPHIKSFRATWTWKRQKVLRLYEQVRMVQGHLDSATRIFMDRTLHNQSKLLSQIHNAIVNNPPIPQETQTENTIDSTDQNTIVEALRPAFQASGFGPDVSKAYLFAEKFQSNPCTCACHRPQAAQKIDVGPIPGKLSVSHSNISHWIFPCRDCECSLPRALVRVDYQFPKWLWNRAVLFKASLSALAGIGASLRLPAVWPSNDPIWAALRSPSVEEVQKFISQKSYTATDVDPQGGSIMEYAMAYDQLSVVLVLLNRFTDILKDTRAAQ